ncbi:MAG: hypothetical protein RLZZ312_1415 [Bacteroidota bacterium]|jgi:pimeloyl-ACP methyl ester carboxylesterase
MKNNFLKLALIFALISWSQNKFSTSEIAVTDLLRGTLYSPTIKSKTNLVIVIAGSGPTDRNGNQTGMTNNSLKMLSEGIANSGTAVFSYDKRILAQIKNKSIDESKLLFSDMIDDAKMVINFFKNQKKYNKIIVAGHSEGSLIGMVAANGLAGGFITLAGAGRPIDEIIEQQIAKQYPSIKDELRAKLDLLKAGQTFETTTLAPALAVMFRKSVQPYMISWIKLNPQIEIAKLQIPILIINGDKDLQIQVADAQLLQKAK